MTWATCSDFKLHTTSKFGPALSRQYIWLPEDPSNLNYAKILHCQIASLHSLSWALHYSAWMLIHSGILLCKKTTSSKVKPGWTTKDNSCQWPLSVATMDERRSGLFTSMLHSPHLHYTVILKYAKRNLYTTTRVHKSYPQCHAIESLFWQASILCLHYFWRFDLKKQTNKKNQVYRTQKWYSCLFKCSKNLAQFLRSETPVCFRGG